MPIAHEETLRRVMEAILAENAVTNLTALRTPELCWPGNVLDSLAIVDLLPTLFGEKRDLAIADIGTGGGFPLLPMAVELPEARLTGMDSVLKKVKAVGRVAQKADLKNVSLLTGRLEEIGRDPEHRERYDLVTARGVAAINVLLEYCSPLVKPGGWVVLWKSVHAEEEITQSLLSRAETSCHLEHRHVYDLGGTWGKRQLLAFHKTAPLSAKYPRAVGMPQKDPLL